MLGVRGWGFGIWFGRKLSAMAATDVVAFFLRCTGPLESELLSFSQRLDTTPDEFRSNHYAMHSVVFAVEADDERIVRIYYSSAAP